MVKVARSRAGGVDLNCLCRGSCCSRGVLFDTVARDRARIADVLVKLVASLGTSPIGLNARDIIVKVGRVLVERQTSNLLGLSTNDLSWLEGEG